MKVNFVYSCFISIGILVLLASVKSSSFMIWFYPGFKISSDCDWFRINFEVRWLDIVFVIKMISKICCSSAKTKFFGTIITPNFVGIFFQMLPNPRSSTSFERLTATGPIWKYSDPNLKSPQKCWKLQDF